MVSSSNIVPVLITQTTVIGFLASELHSASGLQSTTILETSTITDENVDDDCICTPYYNCKTYTQAADGHELIDIRINMAPCQSYLDVCCNDTKITENYQPNNPDTTESNCHCPNPEDYSKEPDIDQIHVTKNPSYGTNEDHTKESSVDHNGDYTTKPLDSHTSDYNTKEPYVNHNEYHTKNPYDSQTDKYTKTSEGPKEDYTTESFVDLDHSNNGDKSFTPEFTISTEPDYTSNNQHKKHKCGTWNKNGAGFRIGNALDSESQFGEFPSMVAIFKEELAKDGEKKLVLNCGGSLIEKDVILTAAHCVIKSDISTVVVRAGEWDLKTEKEILSHQDRRVSKIVTHPDYYAGGLYNDVALIFINDAFSLQDNIQLICLPTPNDIFINDMCYSSGWGKTVSYNNYTIVKKTESGKIKETGQYQVSILKKVELPIVPRSQCMDALRATRLGSKFVLHDSFICAGGKEGKDTCKGDGGSPLMCPYKDDPDHLVQVGIVAWGINCGLADIPAAYVNVAGFTYWIKNEIEKRGTENV
ncbi:phenoloxidase-activating factor 2-like [Rhopalosiphum padi]|uniref:phenoloxidase-activating factor 2-like n=1 Tax=Rhopalosiphum padi TaxID=40932 RepID=UPI00298EAD94|nr:phenoloxidase-activating factor 2-like [Rhopalosiphum padi]